MMNNISSKKEDLVNIFKPYLLSKSYNYTINDNISKELIKDIIIHKSFLASFTYEIRSKKMKYINILTAITNLTNSIYKYLTSDYLNSFNEYDKWLEKIGKEFLKDCLNYRKFEFGKAQKMINVTMKHLYCYNVSEEYFRYCHIALDSMTYTGRKTNSLCGGFYKNEVNEFAKTKSFSNLTYDEYILIQKEMREYLLKGKHEYIDNKLNIILSPFKAEFYIWPKYKK